MEMKLVLNLKTKKGGNMSRTYGRLSNQTGLVANVTSLLDKPE